METIYALLIIFIGIPLFLYISSSIFGFLDKIFTGEKREQQEKIERAELVLSEQSKKDNELSARENDIKEQQEKLNSREQEADRVIQESDKHAKAMISRVDRYIEQKCKSYPTLASTMADLQILNYEQAAQRLIYKRPPAIKEAQRIKDLARETKVIIKEKKVLEYKLGYIETLFPNILDIFDDDFNEAEAFELETDNTTDRVRTFLSHDEYTSLSVTERNQLALDRYIQNRKSRWQVGRDYEMYIGQGFEARGFSVEYTGIIENLEDMGRDLIASKGNKMYIVQCKNWSQEKTIHEKHIFQLYGTVVLKTLETPGAKIRAIFVTSTTLSDKAREIAKHLNIWVYQNTQLKEFPRIKCNINKSTKEKIYHLPFDQQYDKTTINLEEGENYAFTVAEAEQLGFRRAWRHSFSE